MNFAYAVYTRIRVYAYDNTRIRVCLYAYRYFFVIHLCFFCEVLLDKTITSFVRKTQKARAVRLQLNLHIVKTSSMSYRISNSNLVRFKDLPISHRSSNYHCLPATTAWFSPCLGKEYNPLSIHFVSFYGEVHGGHSDKV